MEVETTLETDPWPYGVAFANGRGFVSDQYGDSLTAFDAATGEPLGKSAVGEYFEGIDAGAD